MLKVMLGLLVMGAIVFVGAGDKLLWLDWGVWRRGLNLLLLVGLGIGQLFWPAADPGYAFQAFNSAGLVSIIRPFAGLMEFIRGRVNLRRQKRPCMATIGNFDGVHLGHQAVLTQLKSCARSGNAISCVLIFEPQPIEFFAPGKAPSRLTRLSEKIEQFERQQIDRVVCLKFNAGAGRPVAG